MPSACGVQDRVKVGKEGRSLTSGSFELNGGGVRSLALYQQDNDMNVEWVCMGAGGSPETACGEVAPEARPPGARASVLQRVQAHVRLGSRPGSWGSEGHARTWTWISGGPALCLSAVQQARAPTERTTEL